MRELLGKLCPSLKPTDIIVTYKFFQGAAFQFLKEKDSIFFLILVLVRVRVFL